MNTTFAPDIYSLEPDDIRSVLARNHVGRLAFVWEGEADVRPLHYAYAGGRIYGRTSPDARLARIEEVAPRVAFEVDEVDSVHSWRSVIARGQFHLLSPTEEREEWEHAIRHLRRVIRSTFDSADPAPERTVIFRIGIERATGLASR